MHDDAIKNKLLNIALTKEAKLTTAPKINDNQPKEKKPESVKDNEKLDKPSKANSEFEQFVLDWDQSTPLPLFPPGKSIRICQLSNNPMVTGSDVVVDTHPTIVGKYLSGIKSAEEGLLEIKNLGPQIRDKLYSLLGMVARARGLWVDDKNKLRCPPGTPAANQFTDQMGSNCFIPTPAAAANSGARAARRALGEAAQAGAAVGERIDVTPEAMYDRGKKWSERDIPVLQHVMNIGGRMAMLRRPTKERRTTRKEGGAGRAGVIYWLGKREAIARGKELTRAADELHRRFTIKAGADEAIRLPDGTLVGDLTQKADFIRALTSLMPNVNPAEIEDYYENAVPGILNTLDRMQFRKGFRAFWEAQIYEMLQNQEAYKAITKFGMLTDPREANTAVKISIESFGPSPLSGGRYAGVGATQLAQSSNLAGEGGFHFSFLVNPMGMWTQMQGFNRTFESDGSGWLDSAQGRMHYVAVHEAGHVVDFYNKMKVFGFNPNTAERYETELLATQVDGGVNLQRQQHDGAWKFNWANASNPTNNPYVQRMINAARELQTNSYTGSRYGGRKIDLQNAIREFYTNQTWAFENNINQSPEDNALMAALAGNEYAVENGFEARAEYYAFRRLFGELRGESRTSPTGDLLIRGQLPGRNTLQDGPFDQTPSVPDFLNPTRVPWDRESESRHNLLTRFIKAWANQESSRSLENENGRLRRFAESLPPGQELPQVIVETFEREQAAETLSRLNQIDQYVYGRNLNTSWNISGRMGSVQGPDDRPPSLHAMRVRTAVRSNEMSRGRAKRNQQRGISYGISGRMGTPDPVKPQRPREPDNGPFTGRFLDVLRGSSNWKQFAKKYRNQTVVFFDYETTGFGADGNMPVQIGAVKMRGGKVIERFNVFVNPGIPLGEWARDKLKDGKGNPLTDEWLAKQMSMREAHEQLIEFFGKDALLGGQYTPFDLEVFERITKELGIEYKPAGVIDSKAMADELLPRWTPENPDGPTMIVEKTGEIKASNSLGPLAQYLGVDLGEGWHTADADSEASAMIIEKMLDRAIERPDTSRRLLDVDQVPLIVAERKAKYEREMVEYERAKSEYDQLISGRMGISQFETRNGGSYTRESEGKYRKTDGEEYENTVFINANDAYMVNLQSQQGSIIDSDGDLVGRQYDDSELDSNKFVSLRRRGSSFDEAYEGAGGKITIQKIPAQRINREPQQGLRPVQWDKPNKNKPVTRFSIDDEVSSVTMETAASVSGRMGNPSAASAAKTEQVKEDIRKSKSSIGAAMSDEYANSWPEIEQRLGSGAAFSRKPLTKGEARAKTREVIKAFVTDIKKAIGNENEEPKLNIVTQYLRGLELDFLAHIASMSDDELEQELLDAISDFHAGIDPRPRVQVWQGDLTRILQHGFKTTHEIRSDSSPSPIRKVYEAEIGIHPDTPDSIRPASGYIVHSDWLEAEESAAADAIQALPDADEMVNLPEFASRHKAEAIRGPVDIYGGAEIVLRPETAARTFYGYGDSLNMRFTPVNLESTDPDEVARALAMRGLIATQNMVHLLHGKWSGNHSSARSNGNLENYYEAMVVGGFDANDIEEVILPYPEAIPVDVLFEPDSLPESRSSSNTGDNYSADSMIPGLSQMTEPQYWMSNEGLSQDDAEKTVKEIQKNRLLSVGANGNVARLLAAEKLRKRLQDAGAKLRVRNRQGLDYFDPESWVKGLKAESIEQAAELLVRQRIMNRIRESLTKAAA